MAAPILQVAHQPHRPAIAASLSASNYPTGPSSPMNNLSPRPNTEQNQNQNHPQSNEFHTLPRPSFMAHAHTSPPTSIHGLHPPNIVHDLQHQYWQPQQHPFSLPPMPLPSPSHILASQPQAQHHTQRGEPERSVERSNSHRERDRERERSSWDKDLRVDDFELIRTLGTGTFLACYCFRSI